MSWFAWLSFSFPAPSPRSQSITLILSWKVALGLGRTSCGMYLDETLNPLEEREWEAPKACA